MKMKRGKKENVVGKTSVGKRGHKITRVFICSFLAGSMMKKAEFAKIKICKESVLSKVLQIYYFFKMKKRCAPLITFYLKMPVKIISELTCLQKMIGVWSIRETL